MININEYINLEHIEFEINDEIHRLKVWQWLFVGTITTCYGVFTSLYFSLVGISIFMYGLMLVTQKFKIYFLKNGEILFLSSDLNYKFADRELKQEIKIIKDIENIDIYKYYFGSFDTTNGGKIKQFLLKIFNYFICLIAVIMQILFVILRISKKFKLNVLSISNKTGNELLISLNLLKNNEIINLKNFLKEKYDIDLEMVEIKNLYR